MALRREYATADEIPAELKALYVEKDGKFLLDVDGGVAGPDQAGALDKERKRARELEKTLNDLRKNLEGLDPAKAREALATLRQLEEKGDLAELPEALQTKVDAIVRKRTERMAADYQEKLAAAEGQVKTLNGRLEELLIDNGLRTAAAKSGVKPSAIDDVVLYGRTQWKLDKDGKPVPMKGDEVLYGKDGKTPMSPDEWLADRSTDRPHWFEPSTGGGAKGSGARPGPGNSVHLTREQAQDPRLYRAAKEQAAKAGVDLTIAPLPLVAQ